MSLVLSPEKRNEYIEYFETKLGLNKSINEPFYPKDIISYANGHILFANELKDRPSREIFIEALTPNRTTEEVDAEISKIVGIFKGLSWGHGIEAPWESREIVNKLANAGAFPINTEKGYLEVISPMYNRLVTASEDTSGWGDDPPTIFKAKVLLNQITLDDVPNENYNQSFLDELKSKDPSVFWVIERKLNIKQILEVVDKKELLSKLYTFPWHAVSLEYSKEDIDKLRTVSENIEGLRENESLIFVLIKLDSLLI